MLSSMQEGIIYFARYGIARELQASPGYIVTANPDSISGKFRYPDKIDPNEFPFLGPLRDRIDLFFIFRTNRDPSHLRKYGFSKFEEEDNRVALLKKEGENYQFLRKFLLYGKRFVDFKFSPEAESAITEYFVNVMTLDDSQASNRLHNTLRKCCRAVARLKHKDTIELEDVTEVIKIYNEQLKFWSQIADVPSDPRDIAYQEIVKKLTGQKFKSEFIELLQAVCIDNRYVSEYIGFSKEGKRDWDIRSNRKVRQIRDKFTKPKGPRDDRILILSIKPLTLAWRETYQGGDKDVTIDIDDDLDASDASDVSDMDGKPNEEISDNPSNEDTGANTSIDSDIKQKISNDGGTLDVTCVTNVTTPNLGSEAIKSATDSTDPGKRYNEEIPNSNDTDTKSKISNNSSNENTGTGSDTKTKEPLAMSEDYEAYVARQKKVFDVQPIEKDIADIPTPTPQTPTPTDMSTSTTTANATTIVAIPSNHPNEEVGPNLPPYTSRIYAGSDMFRCEYCNYRDDKWGMAKHSHPEGLKPKKR